MTLPQLRQGIAIILYEAFQCGTMSHMLKERQKRLQRNVAGLVLTGNNVNAWHH